MVKRASAEERRQALKNRTKENADNRESSGGKGGKRVLDLSNYKDVKFYKPKKGANHIDIIPFIVSEKNNPAKIKPGFEDYLLDVYVHSWVGPGEDSFVCLKKTFGKACPICEEQAALRASEGDEKLIQSLNAKRRCFYNVIDLDSDDDSIMLFEVSHFLFEKELLEEATTSEDEIITFADLEEGRVIKFRASEETFNKRNFFKFKSFSFEERDEPYKEKIFDEVYPLDVMLNVPDYEDVKNSFYGTEADDEEDNEEEADEVEEQEEKPKRKRERKKKESKSNACPHNHTFGADCDEHEECEECEKWEECADKQDELND